MSMTSSSNFWVIADDQEKVWTAAETLLMMVWLYHLIFSDTIGFSYREKDNLASDMIFRGRVTELLK